MHGEDAIALADFRLHVADLYASVRRAGPSAESWTRWREDRDALFAKHRMSPLAGMEPRPREMSFWPYDPSWRVAAVVDTRLVPKPVAVPGLDDDHHFVGLGHVEFRYNEVLHRLPLYWCDSYSGGLFLPFRDETNGQESFDVGRYLLDGAKSADLGTVDGKLLLDFNFAYHPSCVWGSWVCPLARPEGRLGIPVQAGERRPEHVL